MGAGGEDRGAVLAVEDGAERGARPFGVIGLDGVLDGAAQVGIIGKYALGALLPLDRAKQRLRGTPELWLTSRRAEPNVRHPYRRWVQGRRCQMSTKR